jgi:hypothetical protein
MCGADAALRRMLTMKVARAKLRRVRKEGVRTERRVEFDSRSFEASWAECTGSPAARTHTVWAAAERAPFTDAKQKRLVS